MILSDIYYHNDTAGRKIQNTMFDNYTTKSIYEMMLQINYMTICSKKLGPEERIYAPERFLESVSSEDDVRKFNIAVKAPITMADSDDKREMYPKFYIPPYNKGAKYRLVSGMLPKTHILSANAYELEILRLLSILAPGENDVINMLEDTRRRISTTCFGNSCHGGECYDTSAVVLRFIGTAFPNDTYTIMNLLTKLFTHMRDSKRSVGIYTYILMCLSELPIALTEKYIYSEVSTIKKMFMGSKDEKYDDDFFMMIRRNVCKKCLDRINEPYDNSRQLRIVENW